MVLQLIASTGNNTKIKAVKMIKQKERLLSVTSIVNNSILDFTIVRLVTNLQSKNIVLRFEPVKSDKYGIVYKYINTIQDYCIKNNIDLSDYDIKSNIDILPIDKNNPLKVFELQVYNNN